MSISIGEVMQLGNFTDFCLVAGKDGLNKIVSKCCICDHELALQPNGNLASKDLSQRLVLSRLLHANNDEYIVFESVSHFIKNEACGLVIHNLCNLPLSSRTLEYANAKKFPIYVVSDPLFTYEDFIVNVTDLIRILQDPQHDESIINHIIRSKLEPQERLAQSRMLNPSFDQSLFSFCIMPQNSEVIVEFLNIYYAFRSNHQLFSNKCTCVRYKKGCIIVYSDRHIGEQSFRSICANVMNDLRLHQQEYAIGIGKLHNRLDDLKYSILESIYACIYNMHKPEQQSFYEDIGVFQIIFPFIQEEWMQVYYRAFIEDIYRYDCINNTNFCNTLCAYYDNHCDVKQTALQANQHENTIRYRLNKINELFGYDYRDQADHQRMLLSVKMFQCNRMIKYYNSL